MTRNKKNSDASFLMQGSILAIASIVSRIVGLIYRVPLTATIGKTGNDYYGTAYEIYNIILLISSYSIPLAVSKLVSARMANGRVKDAKKVLVGALIFALVSGGAAALIVYFGAEFFTGSLLKTPLSAIALRVLAPTLLIVAVLGVLRGFFQGLGTMIPSAISQIGEQIVNAIVSVVAASILFTYGKKVGGVLGDVDGYAAAYGAAGGTLGTSMGAVFALIFMIFIFFAFKKVFTKMQKKDKNKTSESYSTIFSILIMTIIPVLLSTTIYNISSIIDQGIFKNIAVLQGYKANTISEWWGVFTGQYKVLVNVPIAIASSMAASTVPSLTAAFNAKDDARVRKQINMANRFIMVIAFPCAVGMIVLASPLMQLLFNDPDKTSALMLIVGGISIVFYSLSTLSNGILQGLDKMSIPVKNAIVALIAHIVLLFILMEVFKLNIFAVIIANAFYALLMCILNQRSVLQVSKARYNVRLVFLIPLISSLIMGVVVYIVYSITNAIFAIFTLARIANAFATTISIIAGIIVYFIAMFTFGGIDEETLLRFPGGTKLCNIAYKLHLLR
ncbi:MAG: polysaccharide biosynthesis protein [Pseudobutyrivibrio sp.]|nr:polysaccharide biosynthesis protein [Pseudobutyrivibrio sp.]